MTEHLHEWAWLRPHDQSLRTPFDPVLVQCSKCSELRIATYDPDATEEALEWLRNV